MSDLRVRELAFNGLWKSNPALVQLLGLCPLLAVTTTVANALGLGLATLLVLVVSNTTVALLRRQVPDAVRIAVFILVIAAAVTCAELLMQAFAYELYQILGIFLPLITTNCIILGRAEAFARRNGIMPALIDGLMMGLGMAGALAALGAIRELIGTGALLADMHLLFGPAARAWKFQLLPGYDGFLLALLPPGAFVLTGLLIALKNTIDGRRRLIPTEPIASPANPAERRVRVTGPIN